MTAQQKRERAAERRKAKLEVAEQERRAGLSPEELLAEDDAKRELPGPAKTMVTAAMYREVFRAWTLGWSEPALAEKHGISVQRVRQIVDGLRGTHLTRLGVGDPLFSVKFAEKLVLQRSAAVSQYAELAAAIPDDDVGRASVKLGYLKQRDAALTAFTELVQELGWLPRHLGTLNTMMDALQMAEVLLDVMDERGIAPDVQEAVVTAIELRVVRREGRMRVAGVGPDLMGAATDVLDEEDEGGQLRSDGSSSSGRDDRLALRRVP